MFGQLFAPSSREMAAHEGKIKKSLPVMLFAGGSYLAKFHHKGQLDEL